jgi:hypothetical protein
VAVRVRVLDGVKVAVGVNVKVAVWVGVGVVVGVGVKVAVGVEVGVKVNARRGGRVSIGAWATALGGTVGIGFVGTHATLRRLTSTPISSPCARSINI